MGKKLNNSRFCALSTSRQHDSITFVFFFLCCSFRQIYNDPDIVLFDFQVLHWAQRNAEHIVPLYCFDPRHYVGTYNFNLPKTGPFRLRFLLESVRDLRNILLSKGRLVINFRALYDLYGLEIWHRVPTLSGKVWNYKIKAQKSPYISSL